MKSYLHWAVVVAVGIVVDVALTASAVPPSSAFQASSSMNVESAASSRTDSNQASPAAPQSISAVFEQNVRLLSQVIPQAFSTNSSCPFSLTNVCANDVWGYVSPSGREYAILGLRSGTGFVDITDPTNPFVIGAIPGANSVWSDMRTLDTYAYSVNESGGGVQIIDLSQIDPPTRSVSLVGAFTASGLSTVHNISINVESRYLYLAGSNLSGGRLVAIDINDPINPIVVGLANDPAYVHDVQVVNYHDGPYAGREIAFCHCGGSGLKIMDVTNKANMFTMSTFTYPNLRYCHQGQLSADRKHLFFNDELDELQAPQVTTTTTRVVNVENLSNPFLVTSFTTGLPTIDHNLFVRGDFVFEANYTSGLRIFNASNLNNIFEAGYYDTYPFNDSMTFNGAWGVFVDFPSGVVVVSDMQSGLFVFDVSGAEASVCSTVAAPQPGQNPVPKLRYLSISPDDPGKVYALRVTMTSLPSEFAGFEGMSYWVDTPVALPDQNNPGQSILRSRLSCEPVYGDWGALGNLEISDRHIVPGGHYEIQAIGQFCHTTDEARYSSVLAAHTTSNWGDVFGAMGAPDGFVNILDVAAVVNILKGLPDSLSIAQADVSPDQTDVVVNVLDVAGIVDALSNNAYPGTGPATCP